MDEDKPNTSQEVFSEAQMKAIATMVGGLLEKALKDQVGVPQLEHHRTTVPSKQTIRNKRQAANKRQSHLNAGS